MLLWNIRGWAGKRAELENISRKYDICFLNETKSKSSDRINTRDFDMYINNNYNQEFEDAGEGHSTNKKRYQKNGIRYILLQGFLLRSRD